MAAGVAQTAPGTHLCAVYGTDEEHWEIASRFLAEGLRSHAKVLLFDGTGAAGPVARRMGEDGLDVGRHLGSGAFAVLGQEQVQAIFDRPPSTIRGLAREIIGSAQAAGYTGVRIVTDLAPSAPPASGLPRVDYERELGHAVRGQPVTALCGYDRRLVDAGELTELRAVHPDEVRAPARYDDGMLRVTAAGPGRLRLAGEVDLRNRSAMHAEVRRALEHTDRLELDVASLRFIDAASLALLVRTAAALPLEGMVSLLAPPAPVRRVLRACGWHAEPRLRTTARTGR